MADSMIPFSRDCLHGFVFDRGILAVFSADPDKLAADLAVVGFFVDYSVILDGIGSASTLPLVTPEILKNRFPHACILVDDALAREAGRLEALIAETEIRLLPVSAFHESCSQNEIACTTENLFVDAYGNLYPCPKRGMKNPYKIAGICDADCVEKLKSYRNPSCSCKYGRFVPAEDPYSIRRVSVEFGGNCSSSCTYCYQRYSGKHSRNNGGSTFPYAELVSFLEKLQIQELCVAGGEVLAQPKTIDFICGFKKNHPDVQVVLKTNGFSDRYDLLGSVVDNVTISMNGFSRSTVSVIMGKNVDIERIKSFAAQAAKKCSYCHIKYLISPANICDLPDFFNWVIDLAPDEVSFTKAMAYSTNTDCSFYGSSFKNLNMGYWDEIIERIGRLINAVVSSKPGDKLARIRFRFGLGIDEMFHLEYLNK